MTNIQWLCNAYFISSFSEFLSYRLYLQIEGCNEAELEKAYVLEIERRLLAAVVRALYWTLTWCLPVLSCRTRSQGKVIHRHVFLLASAERARADRTCAVLPDPEMSSVYPNEGGDWSNFLVTWFISVFCTFINWRECTEMCLHLNQEMHKFIHWSPERLKRNIVICCYLLMIHECASAVLFRGVSAFVGSFNVE